ncbi:MAG: SDR family NAD(P)-dependent oxidoreductase, partial [Muribaculaceae bacterium]|nr:SDR family NAD(P)-dependent oxidoreductase [Muribaculaceae bacterium]
TVATNVRGFVTSMVTAYRYFADNKLKGRIVAVTSVAGTKGIGISASYSATKRFESTYIESLAQLARIDKADVSFTDIRPGFIRTDLLDPSRNYPMLMKLDYAVKRIVKAVVSGGPVVYIDGRWGALVFLWKLIPPFFWRRLHVKL